jgi:hypothetical protein
MRDHDRSVCRSVLLAGCAAVAAMLLTAGPAVASTGGAISWSSPKSIGATVGNALGGVTCPSAGLCLAWDADGAGNVFETTQPSKPGRWHTIPVSGGTLSSVSCQSDAFCAAVDSDSAHITTKPTGPASGWVSSVADSTQTFSTNYQLNGISCPSTTLCVTDDGIGNGFFTTNPTAATPAWTQTTVEKPHSALGGEIACPSAKLCVIASENGTVAVTSTPMAVSHPWAVAKITGQFGSLTCPTVKLCVAGASSGSVWVSRHPAASKSAWKQVKVNGVGVGALEAASCASTKLCAVVSYNGNVILSKDPTASKPKWTLSVAGSTGMSGIACPTAKLCVALNGDGYETIGHVH